MTAPQQQRRSIKGPVVITANRLWDGAVIYRTGDDDWSDELSAAAVINDADDAARKLAGALADGQHAVGAYIAPVSLDAGLFAPANLRERIRCGGPTIPLPTLRKRGVPHVHL